MDIVFHRITARDYRVMRLVNNWFAPRWVRIWAIAATRAGDGWLWYGIGLLILIFGEENRFAAVGAAGSAAGIGCLLFRFIKQKAGRLRPCEIAPHCWATLLPPDRFSFPSGHSITAFAAAVPFGSFYPSLLPFLLFCAVSVAISRILLGMHFLSDVLAGSVLGAFLGYSAFLFYR